MDFFYRMVCVLCGLIWPSLYCYYATSTVDRVSSVGESVYDLNWFEYPLEMQKIVALMIARSQKSGQFSGLNLIYCTLEAFGKVQIAVFN